MAGAINLKFILVLFILVCARATFAENEKPREKPNEKPNQDLSEKAFGPFSALAEKIDSLRVHYSNLGLQFVSILREPNLDLELRAQQTAELVEIWKALEQQRQALAIEILNQEVYLRVLELPETEKDPMIKHLQIASALKSTGSMKSSDLKDLLQNLERLQPPIAKDFLSVFLQSLVPNQLSPLHSLFDSTKKRGEGEGIMTGMAKLIFHYALPVSMMLFIPDWRSSDNSTWTNVAIVIFPSRIIRAALKTYSYYSNAVPRITAAYEVLKILGTAQLPFWERFSDAGYPTPYNNRNHLKETNASDLAIPFLDALSTNILNDALIEQEPFRSQVQTAILDFIKQKLESDLSPARRSALEGYRKSLEDNRLSPTDAISRIEKVLGQKISDDLALNNASIWFQKVSFKGSASIHSADETSRTGLEKLIDHPLFEKMLETFSAAGLSPDTFEMKIDHIQPADDKGPGFAKISGNFKSKGPNPLSISFDDEVCHDCDARDEILRNKSILEKGDWIEKALRSLIAACEKMRP